jgi:hypothetical protein
MPSTSEKGHVQNVNSMDLLIKTCQGLGAKYNPSRAALKIANLQTLYTANDSSLTTISTKLRSYSNVVNDRRVFFAPAKKLATKALNALKASAPTAETLEDAKGINRKIQGTRASKIEDAPPADTTETTTTDPATHISVSQQSYVSIADRFNEFNTLLKTVTNYVPNETELQTATLTTFVNTAKTHNSNVNAATVDIQNARIARNLVMYKEETGLYDIAQSVKDYVKSIYGASSVEYKQVSKIKFTPLPKPRPATKTAKTAKEAKK